MIQNHFTATGIVFNESGEIPMIKHKKLGVWLPPGGHINENELPCEAVVRDDGIGWFLPAAIPELETFDNVRQSVKQAVQYMNSAIR